MLQRTSSEHEGGSKKKKGKAAEVGKLALPLRRRVARRFSLALCLHGPSPSPHDGMLVDTAALPPLPLCVQPMAAPPRNADGKVGGPLRLARCIPSLAGPCTEPAVPPPWRPGSASTVLKTHAHRPSTWSSVRRSSFLLRTWSARPTRRPPSRVGAPAAPLLRRSARTLAVPLSCARPDSLGPPVSCPVQACATRKRRRSSKPCRQGAGAALVSRSSPNSSCHGSGRTLQGVETLAPCSSFPCLCVKWAGGRRGVPLLHRQGPRRRVGHQRHLLRGTRGAPRPGPAAACPAACPAEPAMPCSCHA